MTYSTRSTSPDETARLIELAISTGVWKPGEAEALLGSVLQEYHAGKLGDGHEIVVLVDTKSGQAKGWSYFAPTAHADGVWDIWWIGIDGSSHRQGAGHALLEAIEGKIGSSLGRVVVVETSSTPPLEKARRFYTREGYTLSGTIADFYGTKDDKVIFAKTLR